MIAQAERELLARMGFLLCHEGRISEAEAVFGGLAASAPEKEGPVVGLALCRIIKGECDDAVAMLDKRLAAGGGPLRAALSMYKMVALGMGGHLSEARAFRARMAEDGMASSLATADRLLDELTAIGKRRQP